MTKPNSGSDKTKIFIYKVPFTLPCWLGLCTKALLQNNQKIAQLIPLKMSVIVSFVTPGMEFFLKNGRGLSDFALYTFHF